MSRPRKFDVKEARALVTSVFTAHGYGGTSIAMLTDAVGLGKQSLYNALGDKRKLYLQALDSTTARTADLQVLVTEATDGRTAVLSILAGFVSECQHGDPAINNCIFSAGLLEGVDDPAISGRLRQGWHSMKHIFGQAIAKGQADGSIRSDVESETLARTMMVVISGLRVTARAMACKEDLDKLVQVIAGVLDSPA